MTQGTTVEGTYEAVVRIKILADYASVADFRLEVEQFNKANKGVIEVEMDDAKWVEEV